MGVDEINRTQCLDWKEGEVRNQDGRCQHLGGSQRWTDHREDRDREGKVRKKGGNPRVKYGVLEAKES